LQHRHIGTVTLLDEGDKVCAVLVHGDGSASWHRGHYKSERRGLDIPPADALLLVLAEVGGQLRSATEVEA